MLRVQHTEHGFTIDVPARWDVSTGQEYDGPLKVFRITLIKRMIRRDELEPYRAGDDSYWNRLMVRGGPSVGLTLKVNPSRFYDEDEVLEDGIGQRLGIEVQSIEREIDIAGFRGFAVVRELPAGSSPMGFGTLPLAVVSRQWWLSKDGLKLEMQGVAPQDSPELQEKVDRIVGSLRS